jgi:hypothetical protein
VVHLCRRNQDGIPLDSNAGSSAVQTIDLSLILDLQLNVCVMYIEIGPANCLFGQSHDAWLRSPPVSRALRMKLRGNLRLVRGVQMHAGLGQWRCSHVDNTTQAVECSTR